MRRGNQLSLFGSEESPVTRVVNLKKDSYDVYIGRQGHGEEGRFGNPILLGAICSECGHEGHDREGTIGCYRVWLQRRIATDRVFRDAVLALRGQVLGCFCKPRACHGDVLVWWLSAHRCAACGWNAVDAEGERCVACGAVVDSPVNSR